MKRIPYGFIRGKFRYGPYPNEKERLDLVEDRVSAAEIPATFTARRFDPIPWCEVPDRASLV